MAVLVGEAHDLRLDTRAVPGAGGRNLTGIERRTGEILPDQLMDSLICISDPAGNLGSVYSLGQE